MAANLTTAAMLSELVSRYANAIQGYDVILAKQLLREIATLSSMIADSMEGL